MTSRSCGASRWRCSRISADPAAFRMGPSRSVASSSASRRGRDRGGDPGRRGGALLARGEQRGDLAGRQPERCAGQGRQHLLLQAVEGPVGAEHVGQRHQDHEPADATSPEALGLGDLGLEPLAAGRLEAPGVDDAAQLAGPRLQLAVDGHPDQSSAARHHDGEVCGTGDQHLGRGRAVDERCEIGPGAAGPGDERRELGGRPSEQQGADREGAPAAGPARRVPDRRDHDDDRDTGCGECHEPAEVVTHEDPQCSLEEGSARLLIPGRTLAGVPNRGAP